MSTCNQLDLQTLGSHLTMPKNLRDHSLPPRKERMGWFTPTLEEGGREFIVTLPFTTLPKEI